MDGAEYRLKSTGVVSDIARWEYYDGANWVDAIALPNATNPCFANGFTGTLDIDFTTSKISTVAPSNGGSAGGGFTFGAGETLIGDREAGSTTCLTNSTAQRKFAIGDTKGGTVSEAIGTRNTGAGGIDNVGDSYSGTGSSDCKGFRNENATSNVSGNAIGNGSGSGNSESFNDAVYCFSGVVNIGGEAYTTSTIAGSGFAIVARTGTINVNRLRRGALHGTSVGNAIFGFIFFNETVNEVDANPLVTSLGSRSFLSQNGPHKVELTFPRYLSPDETTILLSETDQAAQTDVRAGVSYAGGLLTGSCAVPPAASVSFGVPVDATTGTGVVTPIEVGTIVASAVANAFVAANP